MPKSHYRFTRWVCKTKSPLSERRILPGDQVLVVTLTLKCMDRKNYIPILVFIFCLCCAQQALAQLTVSGQLRTRTEMRNGQGTPTIADTSAAFFTSQRT